MKVLVDSCLFYMHKLFNKQHVIYKKYSGRVLFSKDLKDVDALVIRSVTRINKKLLFNTKIKFVGSITAGVDHICDFNWLEENKIRVFSAPGSNAIAVVEYVFSALFFLAKRYGFFLRDKIVGIIGVGNIGRLLNKRLKRLGVSTLLCDPLLKKKDQKDSWKSLEKLVSEADILTFHTPLVCSGNSYSTWHMVNTDFLEALPSDRIIINTSRGSVIDNLALLNSLKNGKRLNVVLDVWENEPNLSPILLSYVDIGTPHIAGYTSESKIRGTVTIYDEYQRFFNINSHIDFSSLFLPKLLDIKINKRLDEFLLNQLIQYIYNINYDSRLLKSIVSISKGFENLRNNYIDRREWSSVRLGVKNDIDAEILVDLGFRVCCLLMYFNHFNF